MEVAGVRRPAGLSALRIAAPGRVATLAAVVAVTGLAAMLRFGQFGNVLPNPFYDAAVRSMEQSWHNFFFGAFEPGGSVSIDKPPVDLWLQVVSVKLFGWGSVSLRLPPALAGTLAVPLLYDTVRRLCGRTAGLAAAAALAVMPVAVLTARSDTMDSVLLALLVLAAWLVVLAAQRDRDWLLLTAAVVVGVAFNVKLFEALLPLPSLALLYLLASRGPVGRRFVTLLAAGAVTVAVSLAWIGAASLAPKPKPFPIGSTNGSVWNVVFKFNGVDRLGGGPKHATTPTRHHHRRTHHHVRAHHHLRAHHHARAPATTVKPGVGRLFEKGTMRYGSLIGVELAAALVLGLLAGAVGIARRRGPPVALAFGVWMISGAYLFSQVTRLHPRYLEAITAAVAAVLGIAVASLARAAARDRAAAVALAIGVFVASLLAVQLSGAGSGIATLATVAALAVAAGCVVLLLPGMAALRHPAVGSVLTALALVAVLAPPLTTARALVQRGASDSGRPGAMPARQVQRLSNYLRAHNHGARYEMAFASAAPAGPLIVHDGRPVLILTTIAGQRVTSAARIKALVRAHQVRFAMLPRGRCTRRVASLTRCAPAVRWARSHGTDVTRRAGLPRSFGLYRLSR